MATKKTAKKVKLKEPVAVKDKLGDEGAKKIKEAAKKISVCPHCNYPAPMIKNGTCLCCGNPLTG